MKLKRLLHALTGVVAMVGLSVPAMATYSFEGANSPVMVGYKSSNPKGMYNFNSVGGFSEMIPDGDKVSDPSAAAYANGKYFVYRKVYNWLTGDTYYLDTYDVTTWELLSSNTLEKSFTYDRICASQDGKYIYGIMYIYEWPVISLVQIDTETCEITEICSSNEENSIINSLYYNGLCTLGDGNILFFNSTDYIPYKYDLTEGTFTPLCESGNNITPSGTIYDNESGLIYIVGRGTASSIHTFTMDPENGETIDIGEVADNISFSGIFMPECPAGAPASLSDIDFKYSAIGSTEAMFSFVMPSRNYAGESISGTIEAVIDIDGVQESVSGTAGEKINVNKTLANGNHTIRLYAKNNIGYSPERRFTTFAGMDTPATVENLKFEIDENGVASLSWEAPTKSMNGGEFDKSSLNYTIIRSPFDVTVANHTTETSFTEDLGDAFGHYSYKIIAYAGDFKGGETQTSMIISGTVDVPPVLEDFSHYTDYNRFTSYNPFDDGSGWMSGNCYHNANFDADYTWYSPQTRLKTTETYTLAVTFTNTSKLPSYIELGLAEDTNPEDQIMVMMEQYNMPNGTNILYLDFKVEEDGIYYFYFRDFTPVGMGNTKINRIEVNANSGISAPAMVTDLTCQSGTNGTLTATVSGKAPTINVDGSTLGSIDKIVISRSDNNETLTELNNISAGGHFSFVDSEAISGYNNYTVTCYADGIKGMDSHISAFVGIDTPSAVTDVVAVNTPEGVKLTWSLPATGINGGYVDPSSVTYTVTRSDEFGGYYYPTLASNLDKTEYTDMVTLPEGVQQNVYTYRITATSESKTSDYTQIYYNVGNGYELPYVESLAGGTYSNRNWWQTSSYGKAVWSIADGTITSVQPYDADGGMLSLVNSNWRSATATLDGPCISMRNTHDPELSLFVYHGFEADNGDLTLRVDVIPDDGMPVTLGIIDYNDGSQGWKRHSYSLNQFIDNDNLYIQFVADAFDSSAPLYVDNIAVANTFDNDIKISNISIPSTVEVDADPAIVEVTNIGKNPASFTVTLYRDGDPVATENIDALAAGESKNVMLDMNLTIFHADSNFDFHAVADMTSDQDISNNDSKTLSVYVKGNTLPTLEVEGEVMENDVTISWQKPENTMIVPQTESFGNYAPYSLNHFGGWITYDGDGLNTEYSKYEKSIPNAKAPMAWEVWNSDQAEQDGYFQITNKESYESHSGDQCLISFTAVEWSFFGEVAAANDNWLISPEIIGGTDVQFYMRSIATYNPKETIELLYTTEDIDEENPDVDTFQLLTKYDLVTSGWREFKETLPLEAKRFAIRQTTQTSATTLFLDDITYTPAEGSYKEITSKGYNVYRDGELIATIDTEIFNENINEKGLYTYHVTSLWVEGESCISNPFYAEIEQNGQTSGIESKLTDSTISIEKGAICLYPETESMCVISDLSGRVCFSDKVSSKRKVFLNEGIYLVKLDNVVKKVIVK